MSLNQIKIALYSLFLINKYGLKLKKVNDAVQVTKLRLEFAETLLSRLNISVEVDGVEKIDHGDQYLIISNHRSIIDPLIVEIALKNKGINSLWIAKKELYNSFFFGTFTRNAGTILLDRDSKKMSSFFKEIKTNVAQGYSICIFPEGTRNKDDALMSEFKDGSQIIAMKNKLKILPVLIKTNTNEVLRKSIQNSANGFKVTIEIGDLIDYKDRSRTLEKLYKLQFNL